MDETDRTTTTTTTTATMIHFARSNHFYSSRQYELTTAAASESRMDHPKSSSTITAAPTSGFFKFLARFSGRRRISYRIRRLSSLFFPFVAIFLILSTVSRVTDACSSRTTPKPRPPSPTPRPNITFHTYKCPPAYAAWYCLNDATCFTVKIGDSLLYNCECADGYMGPRCEYKDLDGSYLPTRPRVMLETASIASGAIVAVVLATIVCCYICVHKHQQKKRLELELATNGGVDTVDGAAVLRAVRSDQPKRPFGSHHLRTIPMSESLKR